MDLFTENNGEFQLRKERSAFKAVNQMNVKEEAGLPAAGESYETAELINSIKEAKNEWKNAVTNYEFAKDSEMVDYYTYKIKACETIYQYYIKIAKEKGIKAEHLRFV